MLVCHFKKGENPEDIHLSLSGNIDEDASLKDIGVPSECKTLHVDLKELQLINSCGISLWIGWIKNLAVEKIYFYDCPSPFIEQVNLITNFVPDHGEIVSFSIPYFCDACSSVTLKNYKKKGIDGETLAQIPDELSCSKCSAEAEIDVIKGVYFRFLEG